MQTKLGDGNTMICGFVPKDAEHRYTQTGKELTKFSVKVGEIKNGDVRTAIWQKCTCWNKVAEMAAGIKKGDTVLCIGRETSNTFEGREGEVTIIELNCEAVFVMPRVEEWQTEEPAAKVPEQALPSHLPADEDLPF